MWEIEFYKTARGKEVVAEFLDSLSRDLRSKAFRDIDILEEYGITLTKPHVDYIEDGLWELRIKFASNISRVFYFYPLKQKIVLLHGFIKKTNKTPRREIDIAKKRMADYLERMNNNEL